MILSRYWTLLAPGFRPARAKRVTMRWAISQRRFRPSTISNTINASRVTAAPGDFTAMATPITFGASRLYSSLSATRYFTRAGAIARVSRR